MTDMMYFKNIFESGSKEEKIKSVELLSNTTDIEILEFIISIFDDNDIELRGEAFSSLLLNDNNIADILIKNLTKPSKNIRGYCALVLANRKDLVAIPKIIQLTDDESAMVRSCAIGALGHLKASEAVSVIRKCLNDPNLEVKKSAIKSAIDIKDKDLLSSLDILKDISDPEIKSLIFLARKNL